MPSWGDLEKTLLAPISTRIPSRASPLGRELWGSFVVAGTLFNFVPTDICELLGSLLRYPLVAIENCIYTTVSTDIYHGYRDFFIFDLSLLLPLLCVNVYSASNHSHFIHVLYVTLLSPSHFSKVILITGVPTGMLILLPDRKITGGCERIQFPVFMSRARKRGACVYVTMSKPRAIVFSSVPDRSGLRVSCGEETLVVLRVIGMEVSDNDKRDAVHDMNIVVWR